MEREVVPELIQNDLRPDILQDRLRAILDGPERAAQLKAYRELKAKLGGPGASRKAAELIVGFSKED